MVGEFEGKEKPSWLSVAWEFARNRFVEEEIKRIAEEAKRYAANQKKTPSRGAIQKNLIFIQGRSRDLARALQWFETDRIKDEILRSEGGHDTPLYEQLLHLPDLLSTLSDAAKAASLHPELQVASGGAPAWTLTYRFD